MSRDASEAQSEEILKMDIASVVDREQTAFDELTAPFSNSLVLFGAGSLGKKTLTGLRKLNTEPLAFVDSNPDLWNKAVDGIDVLPPSEAAKRFGNRAALVVTIWSPGFRFAALKRQLVELGCSKVVSFVPLFQKYPDTFLPHVSIDLPHKVLQQAEEVQAAMSLMADNISRREYLAQLKWLLDPIDMNGPFHEPIPGQKDLPLDLLTLLPDEVFVDCGAYRGDTIRSFLQCSEASFSRIIAFEPDPTNYRELEAYVSTLPPEIRDKTSTYQMAIGSKKEILRFDARGTVGSSLGDAGAIEVNTIPLDDLIGMDSIPTFVKMDIEGAELDALLGGEKVISRASPVLSVCVYHVQDHLWKIPLLVRSLSTSYRFYLRRYTNEFWDLVCFCIPTNRLNVESPVR